MKLWDSKHLQMKISSDYRPGSAADAASKRKVKDYQRFFQINQTNQCNILFFAIETSGGFGREARDYVKLLAKLSGGSMGSEIQHIYQELWSFKMLIVLIRCTSPEKYTGRNWPLLIERVNDRSHSCVVCDITEDHCWKEIVQQRLFNLKRIFQPQIKTSTASVSIPPRRILCLHKTIWQMSPKRWYHQVISSDSYPTLGNLFSEKMRINYLVISITGVSNSVQEKWKEENLALHELLILLS